MERPDGYGDEARAEMEKWSVERFDWLLATSDSWAWHRDAWKNQSGLSKTEAKRRYIATLIEVCGPLFRVWGWVVGG